ncbi:hypothetical protein IGB42_00035 [Andreprevotia sp. IGB-42]|uniref:YqaE/Pmp3 family membrane protein n=1 Tax=Andreprevotia sp. IGB-42 TaxID=2497473 RepID=UPI0013598DAB|nr:YqaE/Pmp3 family membrane protein [Andreprevotia sp. IGB-42]KAF0814959.1 hypothetical protein IGB42_00035 [Andreprevotia sp. IGB-42]
MRLLLAIFLPFLAFLSIGRRGASLTALLLQATLIGWLPATIWAIHAVREYNSERKLQYALSNTRL